MQPFIVDNEEFISEEDIYTFPTPDGKPVRMVFKDPEKDRPKMTFVKFQNDNQ